jgi:hypothetical protein
VLRKQEEEGEVATLSNYHMLIIIGAIHSCKFATTTTTTKSKEQRAKSESV